MSMIGMFFCVNDRFEVVVAKNSIYVINVQCIWFKVKEFVVVKRNLIDICQLS